MKRFLVTKNAKCIKSFVNLKTAMKFYFDLCKRSNADCDYVTLYDKDTDTYLLEF